MIKKLSAILVALLMFISALPITGSAESIYAAVCVNGIFIQELDRPVRTGGGTAVLSVSGERLVLTLDGVTVTDLAPVGRTPDGKEISAGVALICDAINIVIKGNCSIKAPVHDCDEYCCGFYVKGESALVSGKIDVKNAETGIYFAGTALEIGKNSELGIDLSSSSAGNDIYGIYCAGELICRGSVNVSINAETEKPCTVTGVYSELLSLYGASGISSSLKLIGEHETSCAVKSAMTRNADGKTADMLKGMITGACGYDAALALGKIDGALSAHGISASAECDSAYALVFAEGELSKSPGIRYPEKGYIADITDKNSPYYLCKTVFGRDNMPSPLLRVSDERQRFSDCEGIIKDYRISIEWAADNGITKGTGKNTFSPDGVCTRAQTITFIWRAAGSPEPGTHTNPFKDVSQTDYYYKAVQWGIENGVVFGTAKDRFSPDDNCTRAQCMTFIWRYEHCPKPTNIAPFRDIPYGSYYADAVLWGYGRGIVKGVDNTHFAPDELCTRAQIVTFIYREFA